MLLLLPCHTHVTSTCCCIISCRNTPSAPCVMCATGSTVLVWCSLTSLNLRQATDSEHAEKQ
jgi:hypothetical protein